MGAAVFLTRENIDSIALRDSVVSPRCGAVVTFEGVVRDHDGDRKVSAIDYEAYESMARKELERVVQEAKEKWGEVQIALAHRTGHLVVGEVSVMLVAAAPHREEAFLAARFVIDRVKEIVPIWKKEETPAGPQWKGGL